MDRDTASQDIGAASGGRLRRNLRHLRLMRSIAQAGSLSAAASLSGLSQTAVTHALRAMEEVAGGALFDRGAFGARPTARGRVLLSRLERALDRLDPALEAIAPGLARVTSLPQITALIAVAEAGSGALAARQLGLAQPSVQRAITDLERAARGALFERHPEGLRPGKACQVLVREARLALSELDQAEVDLAELSGQEAGRVVIGALPLARSGVLPLALTGFRAERPNTPVTVLDGRYDVQVARLLRGEVDMLIGALRDPAPVAGVVQEALFDDELCLVARVGHPLMRHKALSAQVLAGYPWAVPHEGSPSRGQFNDFWRSNGLEPPQGVVESGSILLLREMLLQSDMLGCISGGQAAPEMRHGLLGALPLAVSWPGREIGLTLRRDWAPTEAQRRMLAHLRRAARRELSTRGSRKA